MTSWPSVMDVTDISAAGRLQASGLHPGESEAIVLATEPNSPTLLMDDNDGIRTAAQEGRVLAARRTLPPGSAHPYSQFRTTLPELPEIMASKPCWNSV
jgi:hypothetical protein